MIFTKAGNVKLFFGLCLFEREDYVAEWPLSSWVLAGTTERQMSVCSSVGMGKSEKKELHRYDWNQKVDKWTRPNPLGNPEPLCVD